jgi:hypothetical protein
MVAVVVMGAALVVGCGDDGEASSNVTKAEFTKEAEAVCKERKKDWEAALAAFQKESQEKGRPGSAKEKERAETLLGETLVPVLEEELTALEGLEVPEADEAKVEEMLQSRSEGVEKLEEGGVEALLAGPFETFEKEAKAYGLDCSMV